MPVLLSYWLPRKRALLATPPAYTPSCRLPNSRFPQAGRTRAHPTWATPLRRGGGGAGAWLVMDSRLPAPPTPLLPAPQGWKPPCGRPAPPPPRRWQPVGIQWEGRAGGELIFQYRVRSLRGVGESPAAAVAGRGVERGLRRSGRPWDCGRRCTLSSAHRGPRCPESAAPGLGDLSPVFPGNHGCASSRLLSLAGKVALPSSHPDQVTFGLGDGSQEEVGVCGDDA